MARRLVIVSDCDDVLIHATEYLVDTYNAMYGTEVTLAHAHDSTYDQWQTERFEVLRRLAEIQTTPEYAAIAPPAHTVAAVRRLAEQHDLHLVTARELSVAHVTEYMIDQYFPDCFVSVEHVGIGRTKGSVCESLGAHVIIDDNFHHLVSGRENGVELPIWFGKYAWQKDQDLQTIGAVRCHDWGDVIREVAALAEQ